MFLLLGSTSAAKGSSSSFKAAASAPASRYSQPSPTEIHGGSFGGDENGDAADFNEDKRKIHTGPNPLHNR